MKNLNSFSRKIANDNTNGSSILAQAFLEYISEGEFSPDEFQNAMRLILESHPDMAILRHAAKILGKVPFDGISSAAAEFLKSLKGAPLKIAEYVINIISKDSIVMTYSRSGTVYQALMLAAKSGKLDGVVLSESRPDMEGRMLAKELSDAAIFTTLTIDAALATMMDSVDIVLVGADAVTPERIINKAGTLQVALAANYNDKPIYVLASSHKFTSIASPRKNSPVERIWKTPPKGIHVAAPLFEEIPLALFTAVICERGMVGIEEIEAIVE